jgi:hypothetical protein
MLQKSTVTDTQDIPKIVWNSRIHYRVHKIPPVAPAMCQMNPVYFPPLQSFSKINFNNIPLSMLWPGCLRAGKPRGQSYSGGSVKLFSSPRRPDRLWGQPSHLSTGYWGLLNRGQSWGCIKVTTHLPLVPRSKKCVRVSVHPLPPYVFIS